ncbi:MAG: 3-oxoacyl-[acyl-carrier-protein] reductase [Myxococcales bacterium]|nr:3-oxoacyl-[acyl-carrier-protein] reductase [Myxococcales bacterium]|tara:strand:- start:650 stop:1381 length:732 start_codon:yes stop_codon:yes gene_type:complete
MSIAIVTGGSRGIGRAIAVGLAQAGHHVVINYAGNEAAAQETLDAVQAAGGSGELARFDVGDEEAVSAAIKGIAKAHGRIDVLVNNAGISVDGLLARFKADDWGRVLQTNLSGAFHCLKAVTRPMMKQRSGRVINIGSVVAASGSAGQPAYCAAKAGLEGLTRSAALELAGRGITVNCVAPGFVDTDMTRALPDDRREAILEQVPAGRMAGPEEIAAAVVFLASDGGSYITGQTLGVNGGLYL